MHAVATSRSASAKFVILSGAKDLGGESTPTPRSFAPLRMTGSTGVLATVEAD
jgi:hypothetical protein